MQQGKALYELQKIDLGIIRKQKRLDEIAAQLADNDAVRAAQGRVQTAEDKLKPLQAAVKELEHQSQQVQTKRTATEDRLYSGSVTNPKELQDMQNEIESLKRRYSELDDQLLEQMMLVEEAQEQLDAAETTLKQTLEANASDNQALLAEKADLEAEKTTLSEQRADAVTPITADHLEQYETLRPQKANQPIALLTQDDTCSACGIRQNATVAKQIRRGDALINCVNCKRILVYL